MTHPVVEKAAKAVKAALHSKLFAMNGYRKLSNALEKTDEVALVAAKAALQAIEPLLKRVFIDGAGYGGNGAPTPPQHILDDADEYVSGIIHELTEQEHKK